MITLEQANAKLEAGEARVPATANLFIRGSMRRLAVKHGVNFYEEKGLLVSAFIFRGEQVKLLRFHAAVKEMIQS